MSTHRIEKQRIIKAPKSRVWRAISDADEFGRWFRVRFEGPFRPDTHVVGVMTEPGYEGMRADFWIEKIEPEERLSYRWQPYSPEPGFDYSQEPKTLVSFALADHPEGTLLTIVEEGFDALPEGRRQDAYRRNEGGWEIQIGRIDEYVRAAL